MQSKLDVSKVLIKNNPIVKIKSNISATENRIFQIILYKLQKESKDILNCEISHTEFKNFIKNPKESTLESIYTTLINLRKSSILFENKNRCVEFGFINGYEYNKKKSIFKIEASEQVYSFLKKYLDTGYTPINIQIFLGLTNYYAQRFYQILNLWNGINIEINYTIDELKKHLTLDKKYSEYGNLKRRVILPALKELNKTGFFQIDFKEIKKDRKVISINFLVKYLDNKICRKVPSIKKIEKDHFINDKIYHINPIKNIKFKGIEEILYIQNTSIINIINNKFKNFNFKKYEDIVWEAEIETLEKDNNKYDSINNINYKYFIDALLNKLKLSKK